LNAQLKAMSASFLNEDYMALADYTFPAIVDMMGGKEALITASKEGINQMKDAGYVILDFYFKNPSRYYEKNNTTQCTLTQFLVMNTPNGKIQTESTLLAVSYDKGANWTFLDASSKPKEFITRVFPDFHPDIVIKPSKQSNIED
jgi:hypothetical protein